MPLRDVEEFHRWIEQESPSIAALAVDVGGYGAGLVRFRMSDHLGWIRWFAEVVAAGGVAQRELVRSVEGIRAGWSARLAGAGVRTDAAAWAVLELLPHHLVLTAPVVADLLGTSHKTAVAALARLVAVGVLTEVGTAHGEGRGRRARRFVSAELLGLAGSTPVWA